VTAGIFLFLEQSAHAEFLEKYCDMADLVAVGAFGIGVSPLGQRLLAGPAHEIDHVLLGYVFDARLLAGPDERIDASAVGTDALGGKPTSFEIGRSISRTPLAQLGGAIGQWTSYRNEKPTPKRTLTHRRLVV
jgi:hypothetical protein